MNQLHALNAALRGMLAGRLIAADCRLLVCVRVLEQLAATLVAWAPVPAVRKALAKIRPLATAFCGALPEARIVWAFETSARWQVGRASCLARALAAELLLQPTDRPLRMVIGVASPTNGHLTSHAWIERDGRVVIGGSDSKRRYVAFVAWNGSAT